MTQTEPNFMTRGVLEQDMADRWVPSGQAMAAAAVLLRAYPDADMVVVPMIQPGKTRGWWTAGQEVRTVPGVLFLAVNADEPRGPAIAYHHARHLCDLVAGEVLAQDWKARLGTCRVTPGTVSHVVITRQPDEKPHGVRFAVFEGR